MKTDKRVSVKIQKTLENYGSQLDVVVSEDRTVFWDIKDFVERVSNLDPTPTKKYTQWIVRTYCARGIRYFEDIGSKVVPALKRFDKAKLIRKLTGPEADIGQYKTLNDLMNKLDELDGPLLSKTESFEHLFTSGEAKMIYDSPDWRIAVPLTEKASCILGRNTRWCTAAENDNVFEIYNKEGPLFIILHKATNKRWQLHFEETEYFDENDDYINFETFFDTDHPDLYDILYKCLRKYRPHLAEACGKILEVDRRSILKHPKLVYEYAYARRCRAGRLVRWPKGEAVIITSGDLEAMLNYAQFVFMRRWPEMETAFLTSIIEKKLWGYITEYADNAIGGRWVEAEPILLKCGEIEDIMSYYARCFPRRFIFKTSLVNSERWSEAEALILGMPEGSFKLSCIKKYFSHMQKKGIVWKEGMDAVLASDNAKGIYKFVRTNLKEPWPEAEEYLRKSDREYYDYYKEYISDLMNKRAKAAQTLKRFLNDGFIVDYP